MRRHDDARAATPLHAWALAGATTSTSLVAHHVGGGALPSGAQWLAPALSFFAVWCLVRPMRLTRRSTAAFLVVGQTISHVALSVFVPHTMTSGSTAHALTHEASHHGASSVMTSAGPSSGMLAAHVVGSVFAWLIAAGVVTIVARAARCWDALLGRITVPRAAVRRRRARIMRRRPLAHAPWWATIAPLRGPPNGAREVALLV